MTASASPTPLSAAGRQLKNLKGRLYIHNNEAGRLTYTDCDFKGNLLNPPALRCGRAGFHRQVIGDNALTTYQKYVVNQIGLNANDLINTHSISRIDGLVKATLQIWFAIYQIVYL